MDADSNSNNGLFHVLEMLIEALIWNRLLQFLPFGLKLEEVPFLTIFHLYIISHGLQKSLI